MFKDDAVADGSTSPSSDDESQESSQENIKPDAPQGSSEKGISPPDLDENDSASPEKNNILNGTQKESRWNDIFGLPAVVLAKLLSPAVTSKKRRFELGLNDKVFVGQPMFAKPDGTWRRAPKSRRSSSKSNLTTEKARSTHENTILADRKSPLGESDLSGYDTEAESRPGVYQDENALEARSTSNEMETTSKTPTQAKTPKSSDSKYRSLKEAKPDKPLAMFHVVFVLKPPPLEYRLRLQDMYRNIIKKFSKALDYEQKRSNYVANESATITSLTKHMDKPGEKQSLTSLYHDLISQSSLARAISTLYNSVASSRVAHVNLTHSLSLSLQIPIPTSTSVLPTPVYPQPPGLWLTTANSMPVDDDAQTPGTQLGAHFTLLLLSELHHILADVNATVSAITAPLTHYLRVTTPRKSFYQISQSSGIPLADIQFLARHLVYWRRARAIPPLHQRDIYIVSPNADMRKLASAAPAFAKKFPTLPSLPRILSMLSLAPRPYSTLIPSRDHKDIYMDILAWLMCGGWVTQLRTFAWIKVSGHIKGAIKDEAPSNESNTSPPDTDTDDSQSTTDESEDVSDTNSRLVIPEIRSTSPSSSTHTTLPMTHSTPSPHSPSLVPNPRQASGLSSRHLFAISQHILQTQGVDSQVAWNKCVKYFDGKHALETIPVREGWKRKKVVELLAGWEGLGVLVRGRHW